MNIIFFMVLECKGFIEQKGGKSYFISVHDARYLLEQMPPKAQRVSWSSWYSVLLFITLLPSTMLYVSHFIRSHQLGLCFQYCILYQMHHYVEYSVSFKNYKNKVKFLKNKVGEVSLILVKAVTLPLFTNEQPLSFQKTLQLSTISKLWNY